MIFSCGRNVCVCVCVVSMFLSVQFDWFPVLQIRMIPFSCPPQHLPPQPFSIQCYILTFPFPYRPSVQKQVIMVVRCSPYSGQFGYFISTLPIHLQQILNNMIMWRNWPRLEGSERSPWLLILQGVNYCYCDSYCPGEQVGGHCLTQQVIQMRSSGHMSTGIQVASWE